jgi:hypothetical protein
MRIIEVPDRSVFSNYSCQQCDRKVKAGQWILWISQHDTALRRMVVHVACVRKLIADVPDEDQDAFEKLRERILATGQAFPA